MRNIDKVIDDFPAIIPIGERDLKRVADLIIVRKTEEERADLIHRCAMKFEVEKSVLEEKVKEALNK